MSRFSFGIMIFILEDLQILVLWDGSHSDYRPLFPNLTTQNQVEPKCQKKIKVQLSLSFFCAVKLLVLAIWDCAVFLAPSPWRGAVLATCDST